MQLLSHYICTTQALLLYCLLFSYLLMCCCFYCCYCYCFYLLGKSRLCQSVFLLVLVIIVWQHQRHWISVSQLLCISIHKQKVFNLLSQSSLIISCLCVTVKISIWMDALVHTYVCSLSNVLTYLQVIASKYINVNKTHTHTYKNTYIHCVFDVRLYNFLFIFLYSKKKVAVI